VFLLSSQCDPNMFPKFPNVFHNVFIIASHFVPYGLHNIGPFGSYIGGWVLMLIYLYVWSEYIYNGESPKFENIFVMGQWKRLIATQKKKSKLRRHSELINMDQTNNWTSSYSHGWTYYHQGFWNLEEDLLKKKWPNKMM
jgi:hypothetical protein